MSFVTPDLAEILLLKYMLNHTTPGDVRLHLYTNNVTPSENDILATFTESSAAGYTPFALTGTAWTFATSAGTSSAIYARQTFSYGTSETVYGYYMTNKNNINVQELVHAERFTGAPFVIPSGGGSVDIDAQIKLD